MKIMNEFRKLPANFTSKSGYDIRLIERQGAIAWYEARYVKGEKLQGYIVAKISTEKAQTLPSGKKLPDREVFPRESKFGKTGWFYMPKSRDIAEAHYQELVKS